MRQGIIQAVVKNIEKLARDTFILCLKGKTAVLPVYEAGHFIMLEPKKSGSLMWRPFSVFDYYNGVVKILVQIQPGETNTKKYAEMEEGETIQITGPKGKAFEFDANRSKLYCVAGGIGIGGIGYLAKRAQELGMQVFIRYGVKFENQLIDTAIFEGCDVKTIVEKCENGGFVTRLLDEDKLDMYDIAEVVHVACGPSEMLEAVYNTVKTPISKCYVLPEEIMACRGTHSCKGCSVPLLSKKPFHICHDGYVDGGLVDWDEYTRRNKLSRAISVSEQISTTGDMVRDALVTTLVGPRGMIYEFPKPWGNAAGCLDYKVLLNGEIDPRYFGFFIPKGERIEPKVGNPAHRVSEVGGGCMLNSIGLECDGIDDMVTDKLPHWNKLPQEKIPNIFGSNSEEYAEVAHRLWLAGIRMVEVNLSCPNLNKRIPGKFGGDTYKIVQAIRKRCPRMFIIAKLTAMVSEIYEIGLSAYEAGANALTAINTLEGMDIDIDTYLPVQGGVYAGLSGRAIYPVALKAAQVLSKLPIPIIGCGGIYSAEIAIKFFVAGATMIQVGTELFTNPRIMEEIEIGVRQHIEEKEAYNIGNIVGKAII